MGNGLVITLGLVAAYVLLLWWLARTGRMEKYNLSLLLGFILMVRTHRGRATLDVLARPRRFWNAFGDVGTAVTLLGMVLMTVFLVASAFLALRPDPDTAVRPLEAREILVIPGVNPFVPLWYGIIALIVTLVVHEGGHGILARANGLRVKSLGLLFAVVPVGAFVEPDENDLNATSRRKRLRVFGAGPMINLVTAAITLALFAAMFGAADPVMGAPLRSVVEGGPADGAGIEPLAVLTSVRCVRTAHDAPCADTGTRPITHWNDLAAYVDEERSVGDTVEFTDRAGATYTLRLASLWDQLNRTQQETLLQAEGRDGVERAQADPYMGVYPFVHERDAAFLADPLGTTDRGGSSIPNLLYLVSLPIGEVAGSPYLSVYIPAFYDVPTWFLWAMLLLFWIFWIDLMVGLTNILPMLPFDGGHIFRDAFGALLARIRPRLDAHRRERIVGRTAGIVSIAILFGILITILGPRFI